MVKYTEKDWNGNEIERGGETFGFNDDKGRACGARYIIRSFDVIEAAEGGRSRECYTHPGVWYSAWAAPTRNDVEFGPSFNRQYFDNLTDARTYAAKRIADCRKRYAKKFVK